MSILDQPKTFLLVIRAAVCPGLASAFPDFKPAEVLTQEGQQHLSPIEQSGADVASSIAFLIRAGFLKENWIDNPHVQRYQALASNGGHGIGGPLLVVYGESDDKLNVDATTVSVSKTAELFISAQLENVLLPNMTHVHALQAPPGLWIDWIFNRLIEHEVKSKYQSTMLARFQPAASYQAEEKMVCRACDKALPCSLRSHESNEIFCTDRYGEINSGE
ncbi:hypothetical protein MMC28_001007 [Mycoblastus sanguinarius]|nr:hypothetical protein [Mycoblastus sanguinarius]